MQEIEVKNDFDAKILINGVPDYRLIIADKESGFLEALELQISEHFKEPIIHKEVVTQKNIRKTKF